MEKKEHFSINKQTCQFFLRELLLYFKWFMLTTQSNWQIYQIHCSKNNKVCSKPDIVEEFLATTYLGTRGCSVLILWVLAHVGTDGKEMVGKAKKGRTNNKIYIAVSKDNFVLLIGN